MRDGFRGRGKEETDYRREKQGEEDRPARSPDKSPDLHESGNYSAARVGVKGKRSGAQPFRLPAQSFASAMRTPKKAKAA
jgi:hypothetical protein